MEWYTKAADKGNENAMICVGWMYQNGFGVERDYEAALDWYVKAGNAGCDYAENYMNQFYYEKADDGSSKLCCNNEGD